MYRGLTRVIDSDRLWATCRINSTLRIYPPVFELVSIFFGSTLVCLAYFLDFYIRYLAWNSNRYDAAAATAADEPAATYEPAAACEPAAT